MAVKKWPLLAAHVGERGEQAQHRLSAARQGLRRAIQIAMASYAVGALLVQPLSLLETWLPVLRIAALMILFAAATAWFVRIHVHALSAPDATHALSHNTILPSILPVAALALALTAWAVVTMPRDLRPEGMGELPSLPPLLAILIPATTATLCAFKLRPQAISARLLGFSNMLSLREVLIGAVAGACLGLHFWIVSTAWLPARRPLVISFENLLWLLCFTLGLQALGEETFFRGVLYRLYEDPSRSIGVAFAPVLLLNAFIYLMPGLVTVLSDMWPWRLVYGLAFATLATWLRNREGTLAAPIAANVVYTVLFTLGGVL